MQVAGGKRGGGETESERQSIDVESEKKVSETK